MTDKTEYEMAHTYLRMQYYNYECADKKQINKIIKEELSKKNDERFDRTMLRIKRRCIQECQWNTLIKVDQKNTMKIIKIIRIYVTVAPTWRYFIQYLQWKQQNDVANMDVRPKPYNSNNVNIIIRKENSN